MLITICRLYDSYSDAHRVVLMLESAGLSPSETSVISNNSDTWYSAKTTNVVPLRKDSASRESDGKIEGATIGAAIGATAATAASLVTMLTIPGVGAGIREEDAQVFVEGVRRGGTLVAARVPQAELPRIETMMNQSAVNLEERRDLYRKSGWQSFDPNAVPYTADQVRSERALHTR